MLITLQQRHGFILPSWLVTPNIGVTTATSVVIKLFDTIAPPYLELIPPSSLFSIERATGMPEVQLALRRIVPYEHSVPDLQPYCAYYHDSRPSFISHLSPQYKIPLSITNIQSIFTNFLRYETYTKQNLQPSYEGY
jgi:hypothetical protein